MIIASKLTAGLVAAAVLASVAITPIALAKEKTDRVLVHIGQNGKVEVHGAIVTGVSGSVITATTEWGSAKLTWTVDTASSTTFKDKSGRKGGKSKRQAVGAADVVVGNTIDFNGALDSSSTGLHVDARVVHNKSLKAAPALGAKGVFQGIIESIASTTLPTTFDIQVGSTEYEVKVASTTKLVKTNGNTGVFADFEVGDTVRVTGSANASNTIDARIIRDLSL